MIMIQMSNVAPVKDEAPLSHTPKVECAANGSIEIESDPVSTSTLDRIIAIDSDSDLEDMMQNNL